MFGQRELYVKNNYSHITNPRGCKKFKEGLLMSKLRKLMAVALVIVTVFSITIPAFALSNDVTGTKYEEAAAKLATLNIMVGDAETGNFRPNDTILRSEFAKVAVIAMGLEDAAKVAMGQTKFPDVIANHWASGYINIAAAQGIIIGDDVGTFRPDDTINYAEAATILVRMLGYEPKAKSIGGFPGGYLTIAAEKKITKDISVEGLLGAKRGDIAMMVEAALTVPMMVQKTWGQYPEYVEDSNKILLTEKLDIHEIEKARVNAVPSSDSNLDNDEIVIGNTTFTAVGNSDLNALLGLEVKAWTNDDEEVVFIEVETDDNDILHNVIKEVYPDNKIEVKGYTGKLAFEDNATVYVNGQEVNDYANELVKDTMYGRVILKDGKIAFASFVDLKNSTVGVVTDKDGKIIEFVSNKGEKQQELDLEDAKDVYVFGKDFKSVKSDEIREDSVITYYENNDDELFILLVNATPVTGTIASMQDGKIKVNNKTYNRAKPAGAVTLDNGETYTQWKAITQIDDLMDEEVTLILDVQGDVVLAKAVVSATTDEIYGIVTDGKIDGRLGKITVFTKDGEEVTYTAEERADVVALKYDETNMNYYGKNGEDLKFAVVSFKLNRDGEIEKGSIVPVVINGDNSADEKAMTISKSEDKAFVTTSEGVRYYISKNTIIMKGLDDNELDPDCIKPSDLTDMEFADKNVVLFGTAGKDADFIMFLENNFAGSKSDVYYGVVSDVAWRVGDDDIATLDVFGDGVKEYTVVDKTYFNDKGTLVAFKLNSKNEVEVLAHYNFVNNNNSDVTDDAALVTGTVTEVDGEYIVIDGDNAGTYRFEDNAVVYSTKLNALQTKLVFDGASRVSAISKGDVVILLLNDDNAAVSGMIKFKKDLDKIVK